MGRACLVRRTLFVMGTAAAIIVATATPVFAHAVLVQTSPTAGQVLLKPPRQVTLRYNEPVEASLGAVHVYDSTGRRIDTGATTKPSAQIVAVPIRTTLPAGAYVVTWRVISADSHPVQGSFTFQVGTGANATAPAVEALAGNLLSKTGGSRTVGVIYGVARWLAFAALALLIGTVAFVLLIWPDGARVRRVRILVVCSEPAPTTRIPPVVPTASGPSPQLSRPGSSSR
jgi:copper transport protein